MFRFFSIHSFAGLGREQAAKASRPGWFLAYGNMSGWLRGQFTLGLVWLLSAGRLGLLPFAPLEEKEGRGHR
jgi:hypothetical protein